MILTPIDQVIGYHDLKTASVDILRHLDTQTIDKVLTIYPLKSVLSCDENKKTMMMLLMDEESSSGRTISASSEEESE